MNREVELNNEKWISLITFLVIDFLQIFLISIIALDETQPQIVSFNLSQNNPFISVALFFGISLAQLFLVYYVTFNMLRSPEMEKLYPDYQEGTAWQCNYSRDEIVGWTNQLADQNNVTLDSIYLMRSPLPNAFTFSLPFLGSVVVLHSNLLDFLDVDEVKSVITHELGHIKNKDSLVSIFLRLPSFFVDMIYLYVYVRLFLGAATSLVTGDFSSAFLRALILIGFFGLSRIMVLVSRIFLQKAGRNAELLSDIFAAQTTDPVIMINALIRLGQRVEAMSVLIDEIRWLESLNKERRTQISTPELTRLMSSYPLDNIDENNAKKVAPELYLISKLKQLRDVYFVQLSDDQISNAIAPAVSELRKKRNLDSKDDAQKGERTIDWRESDNNSDHRLNGKELTDFIKLLKENPEKMMFDSEIGANVMLMDHPNFRRRVISLAEVFSL